MTLEQLAVAQAITTVSTVQNRLDLTNRDWRDMLVVCESQGIGFIPYRPLRAWDDAALQEALTQAAARHDAHTDEIALARLLAISPVTLLIPGTATRSHLEANVAAGALRLERDDVAAIAAAVA